MPASHLDIVQRIRAEKFSDTPAAMLDFVLRVLAALPANEKAGLLRKDGGDNIARYEPAGVNVSVSRVCYPDGTLVKILTDAGPGGANGPAWNDNGTIDPALYIAVAAPVVAPPPTAVDQ